MPGSTQTPVVQAQPPQETPPQVDTFYVTYVDIVDVQRVKFIMNACTNILNQVKPKTIYFLISSNGGDVDSGIALYNYLKALPIKIVMHNIGSIDSIANVIFVAGEERYASPHTSFLFHGVNVEIKQPIALALGQLNEITNRIETSHSKIAGIVCQNTKLKKAEIEKLFLEGKTEGIKFALDKGIINAEKSAKIPLGAPSLSINYIPTK
ncbi:MAG: ATP-dependent Clp protease proteolytic subunit [Patescibacteria group bacterium]